MPYEANRFVETSGRTFAIVERLSRADRLGVSTLASDLDISKGIVHNHLSTLRELGYVRKVDGAYELSPKLLAVGLRARTHSQVYRVSSGLLGDFADRFDTGVLLFQHAGDHCSVLDAHRVPRTADIGGGTSFSLDESLVGAAILALGDRDPEGVGGAPGPDLETLAARIQESGYVTGPLFTEGAQRCAVVPILGGGDDVHGCVCVLLPADEDVVERITEALPSLRERIENRLSSEWSRERSFATEKHSWVG